MEIVADLGGTVWVRYRICRRGKARRSIRCMALTLATAVLKRAVNGGTGIKRSGAAQVDPQWAMRRGWMRGRFRERNIETDPMWGLRVRDEFKVSIARRIIL